MFWSVQRTWKRSEKEQNVFCFGVRSLCSARVMWVSYCLNDGAKYAVIILLEAKTSHQSSKPSLAWCYCFFSFSSVTPFRSLLSSLFCVCVGVHWCATAKFLLSSVSLHAHQWPDTSNEFTLIQENRAQIKHDAQIFLSTNTEEHIIYKQTVIYAYVYQARVTRFHLYSNMPHTITHDDAPFGSNNVHRFY